MFRLLNIEYHKLKHNRASKILITIYFGLLASIALIAAIKFDIGPLKFHLAKEGVFEFPYIWHFNTFMASIIKFFLLLVIVSMMANEYSYKTLKQNLIDGLSKKEFILSKFYTVVALAAISTLFVFVISLILGLIYSYDKDIDIIFLDTSYLLAFFIKLVGFFSFGLFLGIFIKRSAFAVGAMFVWLFIENITYGLLRWKVASKEIAQKIKNLFPLESMQNLIKEPFSRFKNINAIAKANDVKQLVGKDYAVHLTDILIVLGWTTIFIYLSLWLLKRRDL